MSGIDVSNNVHLRAPLALCKPFCIDRAQSQHLVLWKDFLRCEPLVELITDRSVRCGGCGGGNLDHPMGSISFTGLRQMS